MGGFVGEEFFEAIFVDGFHVGFFWGDHAFTEFCPDRFVHELHAFALTAGDDVVEFLGGTFANDGGDGGGGEHDFVDGGPAGFVDAFAQELSDDATERGREHGADLGLLVRRENVDDPVDGFAGVVGVERAENEQASFGSGEGERDRLEVAHFADEDDVGVLAEGGAEAGGEGGRLDRDLALGDDRLLVAVDELDGLLDGDDVAAEIRIDVVEQRRERRGFSRASRASDEDEAGAHVAEFFDDFWHAEAF